MFVESPVTFWTPGICLEIRKSDFITEHSRGILYSINKETL